MLTAARRLVTLISIICCLAQTACSGQNAITGNEKGSEPINDAEATEYQRAIVRCYKTGGSRIVKIMGELRCY